MKTLPKLPHLLTKRRQNQKPVREGLGGHRMSDESEAALHLRVFQPKKLPKPIRRMTVLLVGLVIACTVLAAFVWWMLLFG